MNKKLLSENMKKIKELQDENFMLREKLLIKDMVIKNLVHYCTSAKKYVLCYSENKLYFRGFCQYNNWSYCIEDCYSVDTISEARKLKKEIYDILDVDCDIVSVVLSKEYIS